MIICHVGPPWGHSGTHGGPKMAQNSTKMAQNHQKKGKKSLFLKKPSVPDLYVNVSINNRTFQKDPLKQFVCFFCYKKISFKPHVPNAFGIHFDGASLRSPNSLVGSPNGMVGFPHGLIRSQNDLVGSSKGLVGSPNGLVESPNGMVRFPHGLVGRKIIL